MVLVLKDSAPDVKIGHKTSGKNINMKLEPLHFNCGVLSLKLCQAEAAAHRAV